MRQVYYMSQFQKISLFLLRISMGWLFFYAGLTKVLDSKWSVAGYLKGAKTFTGFYHWLVGSDILPIINFVNEWGLTLLGVSLILGIFVRMSSLLGALLMFLYYLPILEFPYVGYSFLVDEHIIYALALIMFASLRTERLWGLENLFLKLIRWSK